MNEINDFPKIQRGNGVANDNLATLGEIMLATLNKVKDLEEKVVSTNKEINTVSAAIKKIDNQNSPREIKSFRLLIVSVLVSIAGLALAYFAL